MITQRKSLFILSCLLVAPLAQAGQYIPATAKPIADQYIVVLNDSFPSTTEREGHLKKLSALHGAQFSRSFHKALNGGVLKMTEAKAKVLANHPSVAYVEQDSLIQLAPLATMQTTQPAMSWGLDRVDQRSLPLDGNYSYGRTGTAVKAYVIDTGIRTSHSEFAGRASVGFDSVGDGQNGIDCNGHGTHVAGTIGGANYGIAKSVSLVAVRVLNCSGSGSNSGVIAGVDYVTQNHLAGQPAVANMSLGGSASTALDTAVKNAIADGVTFVVAAGNSTADACLSSPARVSAAITIGATTNTDAKAPYSNYGSCLDMFAPGSNITSAWTGSDTATNTISGTSMATPHVTGAAALYLEAYPSATPSAVATALKGYASSGRVTGLDRKSPNLLLYTLF